MEIIMSFLPFIVMIGIMYLLMIRPQQKQAATRKTMLDNIQKGNHVVTIGGLHGIVDEVNRVKQTVVIDCEGVYLTFNLSAIATAKEAASDDASSVSEEVVTEA